MSLLKSVKIGNLTIGKNVFIAPMAGITNRSFRIIAKRFDAGLLFTEMVSSYAVTYENRKSKDICKINEDEKPIGIQVFGSNPEIMSEAIEIIEKHNPDIIDINAGCPVPKVLKSGSGAKLLDEPEKLYEIVKSAVDATDIPITVKMRLGVNKKRINVVENSLAVQEAGAKLITLHPRTSEDRFNTPCMWEYIAMIKERVNIPVCGNGDIKDYNDAIKMVEDTRCDAVMVGRGIIGNPWLIRDIIAAFSIYPEKYKKPEVNIREKISVALDYLKINCEIRGELRGIRELRHIIPHYIRGLPNSAKLRNEIVRANSYYEVKRMLESIIYNSNSGH